MSAARLVTLLLAFGGGAAFGRLYFGLLRRSVRALVGGSELALGRWLLGIATRLGLAFAAFGVVLAVAGAPALLAAAAGFLTARAALARAALPDREPRRAEEGRTPWN